jgi:cytochrome oxidase Cu insertion factor (SCO1/SenC/PrrC family)
MSVAKNRLVVIAIFVLFFTPVMLAVLMQSRWWQFTPESTVNRGELVQPPVSIELALGEAPSWSLLYPFSGRCEDACEDDITGLRQIHRAAGRHREDLAVVLLGLDGIDPATRQQLLDIYPEFRLLDDSAGTGRQALDLALERLGAGGQDADRRGYVVDPAGNLILAYPPSFNPSDMNKDLKRLLRGSERWESERLPDEVGTGGHGEPAA